MRAGQLLLTFILALLFLSSAFAQEDWTTLQGSIYHTGVAPEGTINMPIRPLWSVQLTNGPLNPVTIVDGKLYVTSRHYAIHEPNGTYAWCVDGSTGEVLWKSFLGARTSPGLPMYFDGKLYIQWDGIVICKDAATGTTLWSATYPAQIQIEPIPTAYGDKLLVEGGTFGGLYCIDRHDVVREWYRGFPAWSGWAPVVHQDTGYVYLQGYFHRFSIHDGTSYDITYYLESPTSSEIHGDSYHQSAVLDTTAGVLLGTIGGSISGIRYSTNELLWQRLGEFGKVWCIDLPHGGVCEREQTPNLYNGEAIVRDSGQVVILDALTGEELWKFERDSSILFNTVISDGYLFASGLDYIWGINLEERRVRWSWPQMSGRLSIGNNGLYVATLDGWVHYFGNPTTDVTKDEDSPLPVTYVLEQNYPNPFNPSTTIEFALPRRSDVTVDILNLLGQHVTTLVTEELAAGSYSVLWTGTDDRGDAVSSGVYFYRLTTESFTETKKMMLVK